MGRYMDDPLGAHIEQARWLRVKTLAAKHLLTGPGGAGAVRHTLGDGTNVVAEWCDHGKIAQDGQVDCAYCREVQHIDVVEGQL